MNQPYLDILIRCLIFKALKKLLMFTTPYIKYLRYICSDFAEEFFY
jgi:hypothetical protein